MTYPEIAAELGITLCSACETNFRHEHGDVRETRDGPVLHWRDRPVIRTGLRRFLMLAVVAQYPDMRQWPDWKRIHTQNQIASRMALRLFHRRLPRHGADLDRARVRYLLHEVPEWLKRSWDANTWTAYRSATRWAWPA